MRRLSVTAVVLTLAVAMGCAAEDEGLLGTKAGRGKGVTETPHASPDGEASTQPGKATPTPSPTPTPSSTPTAEPTPVETMEPPPINNEEDVPTPTPPPYDE